jgi:uncharacterized membrane protein YdfJ with MMPL/SSD domain
MARATATRASRGRLPDQGGIHHHRPRSPRSATGHRPSAHVVTAAAMIMFAIFVAFMFTNDPTIKAIGFSFAAGVFVDAFVVRLTLVPAVMALAGNGSGTTRHDSPSTSPTPTSRGSASNTSSPTKSSPL